MRATTLSLAVFGACLFASVVAQDYDDPDFGAHDSGAVDTGDDNYEEPVRPVFQRSYGRRSWRRKIPVVPYFSSGEVSDTPAEPFKLPVYRPAEDADVTPPAVTPLQILSFKPVIRGRAIGRANEKIEDSAAAPNDSNDPSGSTAPSDSSESDEKSGPTSEPDIKSEDANAASDENPTEGGSGTLAWITTILILLALASVGLILYKKYQNGELAKYLPGKDAADAKTSVGKVPSKSGKVAGNKSAAAAGSTVGTTTGKDPAPKDISVTKSKMGSSTGASQTGLAMKSSQVPAAAASATAK